MHEMSIAESVLQVLQEQAQQQHFERVKTLWLEIGPLALVDPEALRFCFDAVTRGTLAEGAELQIITTEVRAWCPQCQSDMALSQGYAPCPGCGSQHLQITQGDEMRVKELEVE